MNGGNVGGVDKKKLKMPLQIGDNLRTVQNAQLVYSNRQDIALTLLTRFKIWLVHNCQTEEDHLNIKIVTALLLYNACTLLNMMEICVTNNNKLKIHPRGMATDTLSQCITQEPISLIYHLSYLVTKVIQ